MTISLARSVCAGAGIAGFIAAAAISPAQTSANPVRPVFAVPQQRVFPTAARRAVRRTSPYVVSVSGCTGNYPSSGNFFVGTPSATPKDYANAEWTAVLGGYGNEACTAYAGIGVGIGNIIDSGGYTTAPNDSFIAGGNSNVITGYDSFLGSGYVNEIEGADAFLGGGGYGFASGNGSFVGAGGFTYGNAESNAVAGGNNVAGADDSFVGAGDLNQISSAGEGSFIGAGGYASAAANTTTTNKISAADSFIGAGDANTVSGKESVLGGGDLNTVSAANAFVGSGYHNLASGVGTSIPGGYGNTASGEYAAVAGGLSNIAAGEASFAGGYEADAAHAGSFVWSGYASGGTKLADTAADQFVVRSAGGVFFYSNAGDTSGVKLAAGSGTWSSLSDRNAKTDIVPLDDTSILAKVATLPVSTWRYKSESGVRHVGPMAQDFYATFGVGEDDRHITSIDEDGVALAAIKALHRENAELRASQAALRNELRRFEAAYAPRKVE